MRDSTWNYNLAKGKRIYLPCMIDNVQIYFKDLFKLLTLFWLHWYQSMLLWDSMISSVTTVVCNSDCRTQYHFRWYAYCFIWNDIVIFWYCLGLNAMTLNTLYCERMTVENRMSSKQKQKWHLECCWYIKQHLHYISQ